MKRVLTAVAAALLAAGCAHTTIATSPAVGPDMGGVVRVGTKLGWAHACPISPTRALTSGHVVDPKPLDPAAPLLPSRWSDAWGGRGSLMPLKETIAADRDLATVESATPFAKWFPIASKAPWDGQPLYVLGYQKTGLQAFAPKLYRVTQLREVAGRIVFTPSSGTGSSGSCLLTADGTVVGVVESYWFMDDGEAVGCAVSVWGERFDE